MRRLAGAAMVAFMVLAGTAGPSIADGAADQFKQGAQRVGEGARHIGEGIKEGAIKVWDAAKAGAAAVSAKFNDGHTASKAAGSPSTAGGTDHH